jgi:hypothetical protein
VNAFMTALSAVRRGVIRLEDCAIDGAGLGFTSPQGAMRYTSDVNQRCSAETEQSLGKGPFDGRSRSAYLGRFVCNATDERYF